MLGLRTAHAGCFVMGLPVTSVVRTLTCCAQSEAVEGPARIFAAAFNGMSRSAVVDLELKRLGAVLDACKRLDGWRVHEG